jgi:Fe-S oxidoreductase
VSNNPAYDPTDRRYYDEKDLRSEEERIFSLCADCRLCVRYCGSFPKLFDAVDTYCTEKKYAEVDTKKLKTEDINQIVDLCFQCKLCWIKCPYTPGDHEWAIDFPRLMARAKAKQVKDKGVSLVDKILGNPDGIGKLGTATSPLANWANESKLHRQFMQSLLGIHKDKKLPHFASKTLAAQFAARRKAPQGEPAAKIAFFSTCYVNYNQPEIGLDTLEVMGQNNVDVAFAYERCCGMPLWHNGDMDGATNAARQNVRDLVRFVDEDRKIVATNPTCSQMIRVEYPRLLGTNDAKTVGAQTMDPMDFSPNWGGWKAQQKFQDRRRQSELSHALSPASPERRLQDERCAVAPAEHKSQSSRGVFGTRRYVVHEKGKFRSLAQMGQAGL